MYVFIFIYLFILKFLITASANNFWKFFRPLSLLAFAQKFCQNVFEIDLDYLRFQSI